MKSYSPSQSATLHQGATQSRGIVQQDNRPGTVQAKALQSAISGAVVQRVVEHTSSPFLPQYAAHEEPAWRDETGIPKWAREEYLEQPAEIMASMTKADKKVGSVYFPDGSRIRTTHNGGPAEERHDDQKGAQFNVHDTRGEEAFKRAYPKLQNHKDYYSYYDQFLAQTLKDAQKDSSPDWAKKIDSLADAHDSSIEMPDDTTLFEVFKNDDGNVASWHPSRGMAVKMTAKKRTVPTLKNAMAHINSLDFSDLPEQHVAKAKNEAFHKFVQENDPEFADKIRKPEDIIY